MYRTSVGSGCIYVDKRVFSIKKLVEPLERELAERPVSYIFLIVKMFGFEILLCDARFFATSRKANKITLNLTCRSFLSSKKFLSQGNFNFPNYHYSITIDTTILVSYSAHH